MLTNGQIVAFKVGTREYKYTVYSEFLSIETGSNDLIFNLLSLDPIKVVEKCYGYVPRFYTVGNWPEYKWDDYDAAERLVNYLHKQCHIHNIKEEIKKTPHFKVGDKVKVLPMCSGSTDDDYPFGFVPSMQRLAGNVYTIKNILPHNKRSCIFNMEEDGNMYELEEVEHSWCRAELTLVESAEDSLKDKEESDMGTVKYGDKVTFQVGDTELKYEVWNSWLHIDSGDNDKIFRLLGIDKASFCERCYGYCPIGGTQNDFSTFPEYRRDDYAAATRVIEALQKECKNFISPNPDSKSFDKKETSLKSFESTFTEIILSVPSRMNNYKLF